MAKLNGLDGRVVVNVITMLNARIDEEPKSSAPQKPRYQTIELHALKKSQINKSSVHGW